MRIVHILTRLLKAGAEENTLTTCYHQVSEGHDVTLVYGNEQDLTLVREAESKGVVCRQLNCLVHPVRVGDDIKAILALRKLYTMLKPDVLHTHQSKAGILARLAAVGKKCAVIHSIHIVSFVNTGALTKWNYIAAEKVCSLFTDKFINVSQGTRELYLKYSIGHTEKHEVVYSGMNIEKYTSIRQSHVHPDVSNEKFVVLMMAAFEKRKRHRELVLSLESILRARPEIEVWFLGQGETEDSVNTLIREHDLADRIITLGFVNNPEHYVAQANVGVLVSEREGLPRVLVQFIAAGVPVVTTWLPGIEEIVRHNTNGVVHGLNDIGSVADSIGELFDDRKRLEDLRRGAKNSPVDLWDVNRMGPHISNVYEKTLRTKQAFH